MRAGKRHLLQPGEDPYFSDYAMRVFHLPTGPGVHDNTYPLGAYFHANPMLFASHLGENLRDKRTVFLLTVLLVAWLLPWLRAEDRRFRPAALFLFCVSLPPLAGIIVVFPRDHYAITLVPAIAILLVQLLRPQGWLKPSPALGLTVAVAVGCCVGISVWRLRIGPFDYQREQLARVRCARGVDQPLPLAEAVVIDPDNNLAPMMPRRRVALTLEAGRSTADLDQRITALHPLWIAADDHLAERFQTSPAALNQHLAALAGYSAHACPSAPRLPQRAAPDAVHTNDAVSSRLILDP